MVGTSGAIGDAVGDVIGAITGGGRGGRKSRSQRIPFLVEGTTSDPRFVADVSGSVIPALMDQLGNLNVSRRAPGQHERSSKPLGAIKDLFKTRQTDASSGPDNGSWSGPSRLS